MSKARNKKRAAVQLVLLGLAVFLAVIWCDALRRGTNDIFVPLLILLYIVIVTMTALPKALYGDIPKGAIWTYGSLCLAAVILGGLLLVHNIRYGFSFFSPQVILTGMKRSFSIMSIYRVITDSWILTVLHIIAAAAGALSVFMAVKEKRETV